MGKHFQAIPTKYRGCSFRSRTEARWAVFFDFLGVPYQFEAEGFSMPEGPYLPDFYIPGANVWVEVKGAYPDARVALAFLRVPCVGIVEIVKRI